MWEFVSENSPIFARKCLFFTNILIKHMRSFTNDKILSLKYSSPWFFFWFLLHRLTINFFWNWFIFSGDLFIFFLWSQDKPFEVFIFGKSYFLQFSQRKYREGEKRNYFLRCHPESLEIYFKNLSGIKMKFFWEKF